MAIEVPEEGSDRPAALDIKLHNVGDRRSVIKRAVLRIQKFTTLPICLSQGGLGVSATYGVTLPERSAEGQAIEVPLSQQLGPDEADRFKLDLHVRNPDDLKLYFYWVDVTLVRDAESRPISLGKAIVTLPVGTSNGFDFFRTKQSAEGIPSYYTAKERAEVKECQASNNAILREFMALNGAKPKWFSNLEPLLVG
jgi:hypothetical protein